MLFGNVLRWQTEYLGRQLPVLPARPGFPRKVKPLVRLAEREMAAYCVLRGHRLHRRGVPDGGRQPHLGYKEALNAIEASSPGTKHAFYFGFLAERGRPLQPEAADDERDAAAPCRALRRADHRRGLRRSAVWSSGRPAPSRCRSSSSARAAAPGPTRSRPTTDATAVEPP